MALCLVTGGAGFIGSHLCGRLLSDRHAVRVLDDLSSGSEANVAAAGKGIQLMRGSICDKAAMEKAMEGAECVFHEAALVSVSQSVREPEKAHLVNVEGTRMVLEAAEKAGARKAVLASSAAVYGDSPPPLAEDAPKKPLSPYGESKLELERLAASFDKKGLRTVCLRYFNVYGPRQSLSSESGVVARFVDAACSGTAPVVYGDGTQTRDFIYVADVVEANVLAMRKSGADGKALNIATGRPTSLKELLGALGKLAGGMPEPRFEGWREGDIRHSYADTSNARKLLGFRPAWSLEKGLGQTVRWRKSIGP